jgi:hypothetical protein
MTHTGRREPLPVHELLSSLLEPEAPVARWYDRLLPYSGNLRQLSRRWGELAAVLTVVGAFRSLSQVIFINHPLSGVLLLLALLFQSPSIALFATVGIVAANLAAKALGAPWTDRHNGIYGFNGALVGSAIGTDAHLGPPRTALLWALVAVGGAAITAVVVHGLGRRFHAATGLPPLTLPCHRQRSPSSRPFCWPCREASARSFSVAIWPAAGLCWRPRPWPARWRHGSLEL